MLAHSLRLGGVCSLYGVKVRVCPQVESEGWLRRLAHLSGGIVCREHAEYPAFAPGSSKVPVGFSVSVSFARICPNHVCTWLLLVPNSLFVFCCLRTSVSRCKYCSTAAKGPRFKACLPSIRRSVLAWRIPGTGEPGGLPSMGSHRVGHG